MHCANCYRPDDECELLKNVYGDFLCEDCWYDYVCSDVGMVEYMISIIKGECSIDEFDAEFLGEVANSYKINYDKLDLTKEQLCELENKAKELGLL